LMKNVCHIEDMNAHFLQCVFYCGNTNLKDFCIACDTQYTNMTLSCYHVNAL